MRKRLVLVVGAIVLGGVGLAVPAIAGAVNGNDAPTAVTVPTAVPAEAPPTAIPAPAPPTVIPAPPVAIPAPAPPTATPAPAPPIAVPAEAPPFAVPAPVPPTAVLAGDVPPVGTPGVDYVVMTAPAGPWAVSPLDPPTPVER